VNRRRCARSRPTRGTGVPAPTSAHWMWRLKSRPTSKAPPAAGGLQGALESGTLDEVPDEIRRDVLDKDSRQMLGRVHPMLMGGEYLPDQYAGEVEIARISIRSTTGDVTSLLARRVGRRIAYRVVDEYEGDTLGSKTERTSNKPLTLATMTDFFLGAWDLLGCLACNYEDEGGDTKEMMKFFSGDSAYYPYFDAELRRRARARFRLTRDDQPSNPKRSQGGARV
jgi:hypothetical protein